MNAFEDLARRAKAASRTMATLPTDAKNACLMDLASRLQKAAPAVLEANEKDLAAARKAELGESKLRRLELSRQLIEQMAEGLWQVAALPDPVGQITREYTVPSGLKVQKVRVPLGVIMMIYEARPNVTIDAFALCFKSGNSCILKGGREATHSNRALVTLAWEALKAQDASSDGLALLTTSDRDELKALLGFNQYIDLVIPRGGAELIHFVHEHSRIPVVQHFHGVCHIFVDESADLGQALEICATAKTSSPAACNAVETLLVHESVAGQFVPRLVERLTAEGVEVRGDLAVRKLAPTAKKAAPDDFGREFLDLIVAVKIVPDVQAAISHIQKHGSNHTDSILSANPENQKRFVDQVESSCVLVNASTRFNDGFQLGLGAEIGISTSKVHAYGPMGLEELTTQRYVVQGAGQFR